MDKVAVVISGGICLLLGRDCINTFLHNIFELFLSDSFVSSLDQPGLDVSFYDRPQTLERVQLGAVRGEKHKFEIELRSALPYVLGVVSSVIIKDYD